MFLQSVHLSNIHAYSAESQLCDFLQNLKVELKSAFLRLMFQNVLCRLNQYAGPINYFYEALW